MVSVETPTQIAILLQQRRQQEKPEGWVTFIWVVGLTFFNSAIALLLIGANDWLRTHTVFYRSWQQSSALSA